jgi:hypothetical protein
MTDTLTSNETPGTAASDYNVLLFVIAQALAKLNTLKLVKVIACSNSGGVSPVGTVTVQALVNQVTGSGQPVPHGPLYDVPYFRLQGGPAAVIMDPKAGDIGMCAFCDRDISLVKASKAQANPGSDAMHDWADGLYLGGFLNGAPTCYVQVDGTTVNVVAAGVVNIKSNGGDTTIDGVDFLQHTHPPGGYTAGSTPVTGNSGSVNT